MNKKEKSCLAVGGRGGEMDTIMLPIVRLL